MMIRLTWIGLLLLSAVAFAQNLPDETFIDELDTSDHNSGETLARFTYADEHIVVEHDDQFEEPAIRNMPAIAGDIVQTPNKAYAEVEFIDGSLLQIADRSDVEFQAINEIYDNESLTIIKLHEGTLFLHVTDDWIGNELRLFRIDTASGSAYIEYPGIYTVDIEGSMMIFKVYRGFGELSGEQDSAAIQSGEYSTIRHMTRPSRVRPFNSFNSDRFERWAYSRRPVRSSVSSKYVDSSISAYASDLDDHGEWRYEGDLGRHVWRPYVEGEWRPYTSGYWSRRSGAMTWVSYDPFGYVTHHYGRWGWSVSLGWYWIPDRYYSPAWVAWTSYNNYVGWCPLGYWNRPYYYQYDRPSVVIINNHRHHWNYVSTTTIINRSRSYSYRPIATRGSRRVTTRPIYVNARDFEDSRRLTQVIRDPKINRNRAIDVNRSRSATMVDSRSDSGVHRNSIRSRDTGTRATSRLAGTATRQRGSDASSIFRRSSDRDNLSDRDAGAVRRSAEPQSANRNDRSRSVPTRKETTPPSRSRDARPTTTPSRSRSTGDNRATPPSSSRDNRATRPRSSNSSRPTATPSRPSSSRPTAKPKPRDDNDDNRSALRSETRSYGRDADARSSNRRVNTRQAPSSRTRVSPAKPNRRSNDGPRAQGTRVQQPQARPRSRTTAKPRTSSRRPQARPRSSAPKRPTARPRSSSSSRPTARPRSSSSSRPKARPRSSSSSRPKARPRSSSSSRPKARPRSSGNKRPTARPKRNTKRDNDE